MNQRQLDQQLAAANPVRAGDLGDSAATPKATALLERILTQPPARRRGVLRSSGSGTAWHRRLLVATLTLLALGVMQFWPLPANEALASWTPAPERIGEDVMDSLSNQCLAQLRDMEATGGLPADGWHAVLVDQRGDNAIVLLQAPPHHFHVCAFLGIGQGPSGIIAGGGGSSGTYAPRGERVVTVEAVGASAVFTTGHATGRLLGQVAPRVARVVVTLDDGTEVQASVRDGWYLAWWPETVRRLLLWQRVEERHPAVVRAYDSAGSLLEEVRLPPPA